MLPQISSLWQQVFCTHSKPFRFLWSYFPTSYILLLAGTGKTTTIVQMLMQLAPRTSVLLCAPTNVAVAEVATRLLAELQQVTKMRGACLYS